MPQHRVDVPEVVVVKITFDGEISVSADRSTFALVELTKVQNCLIRVRKERVFAGWNPYDVRLKTF
jgi:hypothetical protein